MKSYLLLALFIAGALLPARAQRLFPETLTGTKTLVYKLNTKQVRGLYELDNYQPPPASCFANLVDSFPDSVQAPACLAAAGHYLLVSMRSGQLLHQLYSTNYIDAAVAEHPTDLVVCVWSTRTGAGIADASVRVNRKRLAPDETTGCYVHANSNKKGLLEVAHGNDTLLYNLSRDRYNPTWWRATKTVAFLPPLGWLVRPSYRFGHRWNNYGLGRALPRFGRYRTRKDKYFGYLATNKPVYQPGDTVKLKAFVVSRTGKAFNKAAHLTVEKRYRSGTVLETELQPSEPGVFVYEFVASDTLTFNQSYSIDLAHPRTWRTLAENTIELEDYQLDEVNFSATIPNTSVDEMATPGDSLWVDLRAVDANSLPVMDGVAKLVLTTRHVPHTYEKHVVVHDTLWQHRVSLGSQGVTRVLLPDSLFPYAQVDVTLKATFTNSNNETHETTNRFTYNKRKAFLRVEAENGMLVANYYVDGKPLATQARLCVSDNHSNKTCSTISLPFREKLQPAGQFFEVQVDSLTDAYFTNHLWALPRLVVFTGSRTNDTLQLAFEAASNQPFSWWVTNQRNAQIASGTEANATQALRLQGGQSATVHWSYLHGGELREQEQTLHTYPNALSIRIEQPALTYPGQHIETEVTVTDANGQPAPDVNLTAAAVSNQFDDQNYPHVPYLGKPGKQHAPINSFGVERPGYSNRAYAKDVRWFKRFQLDTAARYHLLYPKNGWFAHYMPTLDSTTQVAVHPVRNGLPVPVVMAWANGQLRYSSTHWQNVYLPYAMPGTNSNDVVTVRTRHALYTISNVPSRPGQKLDLSFDINNLPPNVRMEKRPTYFTEQECEEIASHTLVVDQWTHNAAFVLAEQAAFFLSDHRFGPHIICPVPQQRLTNVRDGTVQAFDFVPGYEYQIQPGLVQRTKPSQALQRITPKTGISQAGGGLGYQLLPRQFGVPKPEKHLFYLPESYAETNGPTGTLQVATMVTPTHYWLAVRDSGSYCKTFRSHTTLVELPVGQYTLYRFAHPDTAQQTATFTIERNATTHLKLGNKPGKPVTGFRSLLACAYPVAAEDSDSEATLHELLQLGKGNAAFRLTVTDAVLGEKLPFVNAVLTNQHTSREYGKTTDLDGNALWQSLPHGTYTLTLSFVGYQNQCITDITLHEQLLTVIKARLRENTHELAQVVAVADYVARDFAMPANGAVDRRNYKRGDNLNHLDGEGDIAYDLALDYESITHQFKSSEMTVFSEKIGRKHTPARFLTGWAYNDPRAGGFAMEEMEADSVEAFNSIFGAASGLRTNFNDCGYWVPNLTTNAQGKAQFSATLPDNLTSWRTYVLAMNQRKQSGQHTSIIRSYKPLAATLSIPRFLIAGDSTAATGKVLNYLDSAQTVRTSYQLNGVEQFSTQHTVTNTLNQALPLHNVTDTLTLTYTLSNSQQYTDGEQRELPVLPVGVMAPRARFKVLQPGDTMQFSGHGSQPVVLNAQATMLDVLLDELDALQRYPYYCNEQTASKLRGLLAQEQIKRTMDAPSRNCDIRKLLKRLERNQRADGSFGWWPNGPTDPWMSVYVANALRTAQLQGHHSPAADKAWRWLCNNANRLPRSARAQAVQTLAESGVPLTYYHHSLDSLRNSSELEAQLTVLYVRALQGDTVRPAQVLSSAKRAVYGGLYWHGHTFSFKQSTMRNTMLAYRTIALLDSIHPALQQIAQWLVESRSTQHWNTVQQAEMLATVLPRLLNKDGEISSASISMRTGSTTQAHSSFPLRKRLGGNSTVSVTNTGAAPLFVGLSQHSFDSLPQPVDSLFRVATHYTANGKIIERPIAGQPCQLVVEVEAAKAAEYTMIEVPIPAGCSYGDNTAQNGYHTHREYFKHKTVLFCRNFAAGNHTFTIALEPRYQGSYTVNPATVEMMYFPAFYGRGQLDKVVIQARPSTVD